jgi:hypothetical protein
LLIFFSLPIEVLREGESFSPLTSQPNKQGAIQSKFILLCLYVTGSGYLLFGERCPILLFGE